MQAAATKTAPRQPPAGGRTFIEVARRAQIVDAAIATIAESGYRNASFARIARRAGLSSTGLISYHFAGRDELISEVVAKVVGDISAFMAGRMAGLAGPPAALRGYIEGNVEFIGAHRAAMKALLEIVLNGGFRYDAGATGRWSRPSRTSCGPGSAAASSAGSTSR